MLLSPEIHDAESFKTLVLSVFILGMIVIVKQPIHWRVAFAESRRARLSQVPQLHFLQFDSQFQPPQRVTASSAHQFFVLEQVAR
jgi:hypothetical protein